MLPSFTARGDRTPGVSHDQIRQSPGVVGPLAAARCARDFGRSDSSLIGMRPKSRPGGGSRPAARAGKNSPDRAPRRLPGVRPVRRCVSRWPGPPGSARGGLTDRHLPSRRVPPGRDSGTGFAFR